MGGSLPQGFAALHPGLFSCSPYGRVCDVGMDVGSQVPKSRPFGELRAGSPPHRRRPIPSPSEQKSLAGDPESLGIPGKSGPFGELRAGSPPHGRKPVPSPQRAKTARRGPRLRSPQRPTLRMTNLKIRLITHRSRKNPLRRSAKVGHPARVHCGTGSSRLFTTVNIPLAKGLAASAQIAFQ
jgi:hypothetical protein